MSVGRRTDRRAQLSLLPWPLYALKAALTGTRSLAWLVRRSSVANLPGTRLLFYHRVSEDRDPLAVRPRRFREQMDFLASEGYTVVDVVEAARLLAAPSPPPRVVGLSFDDGYLDVAQNALPVLADHGFTATVFIATGAVDGLVTFDWYQQPPPLMSWDDIVVLDGGPLRFEAHTITHPNLLRLDAAAAEREIATSKQSLEQRLGRRVQAFCYPAGLFGPRERRLVAQAGYEVAVSCEPGLNVSDTDRLALRRNAVDARDRLLDFRAKLGGGHDSPLPLRGLYRRLHYSASSTGA